MEYKYFANSMWKSVSIGKFILFSILFIIINNIVTHIYNHKITDFTALNVREEKFDEVKSNVKVLIAGDSHPRDDVKAGFIDDAFVVASPGENVIETYYRLQNYVEIQKLDIKLVILQIDLHTLSSYRSEKFERPDFWKRFIDFGELGRIKNQPYKFYSLMLAGEVPYLNGVVQTIQKIKEKSGFRLIPQNKNSIEGSKEQINAFRAREEVSRQLKNQEFFKDDSLYYFIRTIKMLQENGIDVVIVKYPVEKVYFTEAEKLVDIDNYYNKLHQALDQNQIYCPILDYHDLYWDRPENFRDADHLNDKGAVEFTKRLKTDLEEMGLLP